MNRVWSSIFFLACLISSTAVSRFAFSQSQPAVVDPQPKVMKWWETVRIEHDDRMNRLRRLSSKSLIAAPNFYEYLISKKDLPGFPVDMPILRVVFEDRVFFDTAEWKLRSDAEGILDTVAESLRREPPDVALFVAGHTDSRGSEEYNLDLSIKRAASVAESLLRRGIGVSGIWRVGFGKAVPIRPNDSASNMAMNRRVEFLFASKPAAVGMWLAKQIDVLCADQSVETQIHCRTLATVSGRFTAVPITLSSLTQFSTTAPNNAQEQSITKNKYATESLFTETSLIEIRKIQPIQIDLRTKTIQVGAPLK